jgi:hypothetical protein
MPVKVFYKTLDVWSATKSFWRYFLNYVTIQLYICHIHNKMFKFCISSGRLSMLLFTVSIYLYSKVTVSGKPEPEGRLEDPVPVIKNRNRDFKIMVPVNENRIGMAKFRLNPEN